MAVLIGSVKKGKKYPVSKEYILLGSVAAQIRKKTPVVRVRVSRGKSYDPKKKVTGQMDAIGYFREYMTKNRVEGQEQFLVMYLGRGNQVYGIYPHSIGTMTSATLEPKLITEVALQLAAESVITCHNHPSGNLKPSEADIAMAANLKKALALFQISLLDNIILTKNESNSFGS